MTTFDPASLSQETREDIMRKYLSSMRKRHEDPFTIWHREMEYCDSLIQKMEQGKALDDEYIRSRVVLYEIERMMREKGIPVPVRKRTLADLVDEAPIASISPTASTSIASTSTSSTASISPTGENERSEAVGKEVDKAVDKAVEENSGSESVLAWLDSFDPATLTLEERVEISSGIAEDVEKQYAHHREMLRKALARNLSAETCRRNLSHALQFKIQVSLVQLREKFNPATFSERLRTVRTAAGDTIEQMAAKLGKKVEEVSRWESGAIDKRNAITNDDLIKICNFYGVRVEELVF